MGNLLIYNSNVYDANTPCRLPRAFVPASIYPSLFWKYKHHLTFEQGNILKLRDPWASNHII
jgi:hypothetical protein